MRVFLLVLALAMAGCGSNDGRGPASEASAVEGWVTDARLIGIPGAIVTAAGTNATATTDGEGRFVLSLDPRFDGTLTARAEGYTAASTVVTGSSGSFRTARIQLERQPVAAPYTTVESYRGFLQCAVVAIAEGSEPHDWTGFRCSTIMQDDRTHWLLPIPEGIGGMVFELAWNATNSMANTMVLRVDVAATGEPLGVQESISMVRVQPAQENLRRTLAEGNRDLLVTVDAGAGDTEQEEGSVGVFLEQAFTIYATSFFNQPVDPGYSIANP